MTTAEIALTTPDVSHLQTEANAASLAVERLPVTTPEEFETASRILQLCKGRIAKVDELRKAWKRPHLDAGRQVDAAFSTPLTVFRACESELKAKLALYHAEVEAARVAALPAIQGAHEAGDYLGAVAAANAIPDTPESKGVSFTEFWTYEVVDLAAVPRDFLAVDDRKVRTAIKKSGGSIPGLRVYKETRVRAGKLDA